MADKQITELTEATTITGVDLFVLEQDGTAKKLTGQKLLDFVTLSVVSVTVTTLPAGSQATAVYDKATGVLSLGIPQGKQGVQGETGATGATGLQGPANVLTIGSVTSGKVASATITGEAPNQVLNLILEKGETGPAGKDGVTPEIVEGELVAVPSAGGGSSPDISLGLTAATIGQIIKVKAVDTDGKPTAWEAVDMATGGGGETWENIAAVTLEDAATTVTINQDSDGSAISLKKVRILIEGSATDAQDLFLNNARYIRVRAVGRAASVGALSAEPFCGKM